MTDQPVNLNAVRSHKKRLNDLMSPIETLEEMIRDIKAGHIAPNKLLLLHLRADGNDYDQGYYACDLKTSEKIALCETMRPVLLREMNLND